MKDDAALLRHYAEEGSEEAFAELARRHVDLVFAAALRRTGGDSHQAADVAQQVFTMLAQQAGRLAHHPVLVAWLHTATRNAALNLMRAEKRRRSHERVAAAMASPELRDGARADWDRIRPALDAAVDQLADPDRAAVILRFLEHRAFAEIGKVLRVSEDAARMRTDRALEKLRVVLGRRGITSTAVALEALLAAQPAVSAPAGLAPALAAGAMAAQGASAAMTTFTFMNIKIATAAALGALLLFGFGHYVGSERAGHGPAPGVPGPAVPRGASADAALEEQVRRLRVEGDQLQSDMERLVAINARLAAEVAPRGAAVAKPMSLNIGMPVYEQQRLMMNNLRQIDAARAAFLKQKGQAPASVRDLVGAGSFIRQVRTVSGEGYENLSMEAGQPLTVTAPDGTAVTLDPGGATTTVIEVPPAVARMEELGKKVQPTMGKALEAYRAANSGKAPGDQRALIPYFATPQDGADFVEFLEAQKEALGR